MTGARPCCYLGRVEEPGKKRQYLRRAVSVEFRVRDVDDVMGGELLFDSVDISEGGAFLRSDYLLELGDQVEVTFSLALRPEPFTVRARVAWVTKRAALKGDAGMGLEFIDLVPADRDAIDQFVHRHQEA